MVVSTSDIIIKPVQVYQRPTTGTRNLSSYTSDSLDPIEQPTDSGSTTTITTEPSQNVQSKTQNFGAAVAGSASGVGGFFKYFFKGMYVDMPLAATEGLRSLPKLYGGEVREIGLITDFQSGAKVAGKNFVDGFVDGFTDLVREPMRGGREEGALGAIRGVGKGSTNMVAKVSSGEFVLYLYSWNGGKVANTFSKACWD